MKNNVANMFALCIIAFYVTKQLKMDYFFFIYFSSRRK